MQNPFESGHIKNYILLYASVVVIVVLFFIASTLFHDVKKVDTKQFNTAQNTQSNKEQISKQAQATTHKKKFKLLDKAY